MAFTEDTKNRLTIALASPAAADEVESTIAAEISDTAYNATTWDAVTTIGASKNALRDKFVLVDAANALCELAANVAADSRAACVAQTITNGVTTSAPSQDAVFDALALKLTATQAANVAALAGTLTGSVTGTMANTSASACGGGATPANTDVDTCVASLATSINLQLKELQTKLNAEIAALKLTNIQASS